MGKSRGNVEAGTLLRAQVFAVAVISAIALVFFLVALDFVRTRLEHSSDRTTAALLAFRVHDELSQSLEILNARAEVLIDDRPAEERPALRKALFGPDPSLVATDFPIPLTLKETAVLQSTYDTIVVDAGELYAQSGQPQIRAVLVEVESLKAPLNVYLLDPSGRNFHILYVALSNVEGHARSAIPDLVGQVHADDSSLRATIRTGGFASLAVMVGFAGLFIIFTSALSKRVQALYVDAADERSHLRKTTADLQRRNDQLAALYTVFTEITDTLSLRYVVTATLREALRLMQCDHTVLRLLKDGQLVVAGNLNRNGGEIEGLEAKALGEDAPGRVAKRGRSLRIGEDSIDLMDPQQRQAGMRSGLIVPLIIGARVVGTLSVWSAQPDAFSEADERILEMMGQQVATAVVAADTTETSEHRAHHDPLTGLPNRLQLTEDIAGELRVLERAVVAMVDIDHFKRFNDDFGHHVGDVSLQKVAATLRNSVREEDRVYRYGGEEFVVMFLDVSGDLGHTLADRVRAAIASTPLTGDQLEPVGPVTISMGLAVFPEDGNDFNSLIEMADLAMYRAKSLGRNKIATWSRDVVASDLVA